MYAKNTSVSVDRSQAEIKKILTKYKATSFAFGESSDKAMIQFDMTGKRVRFILPMPILGKQKDHRGWVMNQNAVSQLERSRWRALVLIIKAKLESVEAGITTIEQEFMAHIVLPNGKTVGEIVLPEIEMSYQSGKMPALLGMGT